MKERKKERKNERKNERKKEERKNFQEVINKFHHFLKNKCLIIKIPK